MTRRAPPADAQNACLASGGGPQQDCGWIAEDNARYCTAGEQVTVGCNSTSCSSVTFTCPPVGQYRVLTSTSRPPTRGGSTSPGPTP